MTGKARPRICFAATEASALRVFMGPVIRILEPRFHVAAAANGREPLLDVGGGVRIPLHGCRIERRPAPWRDLLALWCLWRLFRRERFDIVHSLMPKAGLLAMLAAWLARVPVRIHIFTGQVWATRSGPGRWLLKWADRITARLATHVLADSPGQRAFMGDEGVCPVGRVTVLGQGSVCGVDVSRFRPDARIRAERRSQLRLPSQAVVMIFVGRMNPDKGVLDLARAFADLAADCPDLYLLFVGPDEAGMRTVVNQVCANVLHRIRHLEYTQFPEQEMMAADFLCLPSRREGFGSVVIEAAACGLPAVGCRIYGLTDAIVEGVTGLLSAPGDQQGLGGNIRRLATDAGLRQRLGAAALLRARNHFDQERMQHEWRKYYDALPCGCQAGVSGP